MASAAILLDHDYQMHTTTPDDSGNIPWSNCKTLAIDIFIGDRQGTNPTVTFTAYRLGADGVTYFPMWTIGPIDVSGTNVTPISESVSIGPGCSYPLEIGDSGKIGWTIGGTSSPGGKFSVSVQGK